MFIDEHEVTMQTQLLDVFDVSKVELLEIQGDCTVGSNVTLKGKCDCDLYFFHFF